MASAAQPCAKYQYIVTPSGPKIVPVPDVESKDEESPAEYNAGGYLQIKVKDTFKDGRYVVLRKLGWGHFSTVWLVKDIVEHRHSALKVVKSAGRYAETARDEIKLLRQVMAANPSHPGRSHVVSFLDAFQHCGPEDLHVCIVFEPLGENLLALIERNKKKGVPSGLVKAIARQVLEGLSYLHDECDLVHTDIKPENIMISIPDVESHIQAELSVSPTPTSRKVGVPHPKATRNGLAIPRRSHAGDTGRHVQIFDSQPLSSPSTSPKTRNGLMMSRINSGASLNEVANGKKKAVSKAKKNASTSKVVEPTLTPQKKQGSSGSISSEASSSSTNTTSSSLSMSTSALASSSTPPTSLGSAFSKLTISSTPVGEAAFESPVADSESGSSLASQVVHEVEDEEYIEKLKQPQAAAPTGPSLLSQTAPPKSTPCHTPSSSTSTASPTPVPSSEHTPTPATRCSEVEEEDLHEDDGDEEPCASSPLPPPIWVKIADLGNATPSKKHFTEDIQTRQYRSPEAILGRTDWGCSADVWSVACVVFELLTAEYLFDPQGQGELFNKDDDHMAQIIELLGDFDLSVKMGGRYSRELFDHAGALRYIKTLKPWPLKNVMVEKYAFSKEETELFCDFMLPMLETDYRKRAKARDMLDHPWLQLTEEEIDEGW